MASNYVEPRYFAKHIYFVIASVILRMKMFPKIGSFSYSCTNLSFSGVEAREQLLSTEQMQSVIRVSKLGEKRGHDVDDFVAPFKFQKGPNEAPSPAGSNSCSSEDSLATSRMEELESIIKSQARYEDLIAERYSNSMDSDSNIDDELPKLEAIDTTSVKESDVNGDTTDSDLLWRAPFVMLPENDTMLFLPGCSPISVTDEDAYVEEDNPDELAARAPFVPPPNDDTILTFNDLPDSPMFSGFGSQDGGCKMPELYLEEPFEDKLVGIGPAAVPASHIKRNVQGCQKATRGAKKDTMQDGKQKGFLPWISTTEAEMNAPSGRLLDGDDLLSALDVVT